MRVDENSVDATWRTYSSRKSLRTWDGSYMADGLLQAWTRVGESRDRHNVRCTLVDARLSFRSCKALGTLSSQC